MKIGLDFDGVIINQGKLKADGAKKLYDVDIPPAQFRRELVVGRGLLTVEQYRKLQENIYGMFEGMELMEPVKDVLVYLPWLIVQGHAMLVITSRNEEGLCSAKEWSAQQGLLLDFVGVGQGNSKAEAARGLDVYIDDDLDKLEPLVGIVPHLFLFSWEYNKHVDVGSVARRVASWKKFYSIIQSL